jgi:hypothetical protein
MNRRIVGRQWMPVLVGVLACLAVASGQTVYTQGADLHVGTSGVGDLYVGDDLSVADHIGCDSMEVSSELEADVILGGGIVADTQFVSIGYSYFFDYVGTSGTVDVGGKLYVAGG